jgi:membrane AbrB-like protein
MPSLVQSALIALAGAVLFERLGLPAGALLGALVAVAACNLLGHASVEPTKAIQFLALAALGWGIGAGITPEILQTMRRAALPLVLMVVALLVFAGLSAVVVTRLGVMDGATAFLAASPGALSQMSGLAQAVGADASLVVAVHTARVVSLVLVAPFVARLVAAP